MERPNSGITWIRANPAVRNMLTGLGNGTLEVSHDALDALPPGRAVEYLRGLLIDSDALPARDRHLAMFERWLADKLDHITDPDHRALIDQFSRWHIIRKMRQAIDTEGQVTTGSFLRAKQTVTVSIQFLRWLDERGVSLAACTQHDIDAWFASGPSTRQHSERFLYWCRTQQLTTKLELPHNDRSNPQTIAQKQRESIVRELLTNDTLSLDLRVAGCLIALFGQPVGRIIALTTNDVRTEPQVRIRLAQDWLDVPEPMAQLLQAHLADRGNTNTAANRNSPWLFPGRMPQSHINRDYVVTALRRAGVPPLALRTTTWQQLVREVPPQVLADALGISAATFMTHAARAGADWTTYANIRSPHRS